MNIEDRNRSVLAKVKVSNIEGDNGPVKNQYVITVETEDSTSMYFQSYHSIVAVKKFVINNEVQITLDRQYWNYSNTTGKYRNIFLGENKAATERKIASGEYKLADLNE
jgi:hypothetical protein